MLFVVPQEFAVFTWNAKRERREFYLQGLTCLFGLHKNVGGKWLGCLLQQEKVDKSHYLVTRGYV